MYRHYIRLNDQQEVIKAFSDAFETPEPNDIMVADTEERHFNLDLAKDGVQVYKWDGVKLLRRTDQEIEAIAEPGKAVASSKARILELDKLIPRALEDLYDATLITPVPELKKVIDEKIALRSILRK